MTKPTSPEAAVLFLLASGNVEHPDLAPALARVADWPYLLSAAMREHAVTLLHAACERHAAVVPDEVRQRLRQQDRMTRFLMAYLQDRVAASTAALRVAGIRAVLLKGAAMAASMYPTFGERPMIDVDLLVAPADARRARDVLLAHGWTWRADKPLDADYSHLHHLPELRDAKGVDISLELHTGLFPPGHPFGIAAEDILASARPVVRGSSTMLIPHVHHLIIHAATHFTWSHLLRSGGWRTLRDVGTILARHELDWNAFVAEVRRTRAVTSCYWTLLLARELAAVPVPDVVLRQLQPPLPRAVRERLLRFFSGLMLPSRAPQPPITVRRVLWTLGMLPAWSGHGSSRPWKVLALAPADARHRALRQGEERGRLGRWIAFARDVIPLSLAVKSERPAPEEL